MKIAVSSTNGSLNANVSDVFGRSPYFIIAEIEGGKMKETETIENKSTDQMSGAGISAAQLMAEKNVSAVIAGNIGPRALEILKQFDIEAYLGKGKIDDVLQEFIEGKLEKIA